MNFTFYRPCELELNPVRYKSGRQPAILFNLRMLFSPGGNWQTRGFVHVPPAAQDAFRKGEVVGFHLETVGANSVAARSLTGAPNLSVLGLELADSRKLATVPHTFARARHMRLALVGIFAIAGAGAATTPLAWSGGLAVGVASHLVRTALTIRTKLFWPACVISTSLRLIAINLRLNLG